MLSHTASPMYEPTARGDTSASNPEFASRRILVCKLFVSDPLATSRYPLSRIMIGT